MCLKNADLKVVYFNRGKRKNNFSIELLFKNIQNELKGKIDIGNYYNIESRSRWLSIWDARKYQGDIDHITGDVNYLAIGLTPSKTVLTVHDLGYYENTVHSAFKRTLYGYFWFKLPLRRAKIITTVSEFTKQKLLHYFSVPEEKIKVIPNPLFPQYKYSPKQQSEKPIILQIGSGKHKNLEGLIKASDGIHCKLRIIGFPSNQEIELLNSYNADFEILNKLSDTEMIQAYISSDILYFASFYEGFGLPIIEANAIGRPVITSNVTAMPEVASDAAHIVDPTNVEDIKDGLLRIINNEHYRNMLIENGLNNAKKYSLKEIASKYYEIYNHLSSADD